MGQGRSAYVRSTPMVLALLAASAAQGCNSGRPGESGTSGSIDGRVSSINQHLSLKKEGDITTTPLPASAPSGYVYVAAVDSPVNVATGHVLQATNFAFDADRAYVTYNIAGPQTEGALDIIDLTDTTRPRLLSSLVFSSAEFADVARSGKYALLIGMSEASDGGTLMVVDVGDPAHPVAVAELPLGSHYGTSITIDGREAYITTGSNGGVVRVDIKDPASPELLEVVPLSNALYALRSGGGTLALGGNSDTRLHFISGGRAREIAVIGSQHFEAPGRMAIVDKHVVTNGAQTGLSVLKMGSDNSSARLTFHANLPGTGNGLDVADSLAILAQGEAGTFVYDFKKPHSPSLLGSFAFPDERGSANQVRFGSSAGANYIFLSNGSTGFRIVEVAR